MELEDELFLATIEWTWECCLKQKESDNEKSVALCKAYKGGQFGLLQVDQTDEQGKIEYRKVLPYRYDNIIYLGCGIFCLFQSNIMIIMKNPSIIPKQVEPPTLSSS